MSVLQNDRMLIADPKALQHILQTSGYKWQKYTERKELSRLTGGRGILWADGNIEVKVINFFYQLIVYGSGDVHKRHRKVMLPGFGFPEAKNFIPLFSACAESVRSLFFVSWTRLTQMTRYLCDGKTLSRRTETSLSLLIFLNGPLVQL